MRAFRLLSLLMIATAFFARVQAQDEPSVLRLFPEDMGGTFTAVTGTIIEVNLEFSGLNVAYDPQKLQFLDFTLPDNAVSSAETTIVMPDTVNPEPPTGAILPQDGGGEGGVVAGSEGNASPANMGAPNAVGADVPPALMTPEVSVAEGEVAVSGVAIAMPAGQGSSAGGSGTPSYSMWRFRAIAPGETTLSLMTFRPPCPETQPCPMMPDFLVTFDLSIEGSAIAPEPESVDARVVVVSVHQVDALRVSVEPGQIVHLEVPALEPPYRVIYDPTALRLLAGDGLRFLVNPFGMPTRLGVMFSSGETYAATLMIEPECESCDVMTGG